MYPKWQVNQYDLCCSGQSSRDRVLAAETFDDPIVLPNDLGVPTHINFLRRQLPSFLPKQLIHFDEAEPSTVSEIAGKRRFAPPCSIADNRDPCHD